MQLTGDRPKLKSVSKCFDPRILTILQGRLDVLMDGAYFITLTPVGFADNCKYLNKTLWL